jgi:16S rRNA (cytidine1402-2'-O)-methyltransferase
MTATNKGRLFIIPTPLGNKHVNFIHAEDIKKINHLQEFIVENTKPARENIKKLKLKTPIQEINLYENNNNKIVDLKFIKNLIDHGKDVGMISDCGIPCAADPGSNVVYYCHQNEIEIINISGASSILISLIKSGFNGQNFEFIGYLPREENKIKEKLNQMNTEIIRSKKTFIFIETPYRNNNIFNILIKNLPDERRLSVSIDLYGENELTLSQDISAWKKKTISFEKKPCIFLIN